MNRRVTITGVEDQRMRVKVAAQVHDYEPAQRFDPRKLPLLDRVSQFALIAARQAVAQPGLEFRVNDPGRCTACVIGTGTGGEETVDEGARRIYKDNNPRLHPLSIVRRMVNAPASQAAIEFGITGPTFCVSSACATSTHAFVLAFTLACSGIADATLAGGTEACLTLGVMRAWEAMRVLADDTCRPFCKRRRGLMPSEGPGMIVLENFDHARARGAEILAEFAGAGRSADAGDSVLPSADGAAQANMAALQDAQLNPADIGYINAHAAGTPANDPSETKAIHKALGEHAKGVANSSTKSVRGHAFGAAGALEIVAALGVLRDGAIPPTANFIDPDPECDLDYVPNTARAAGAHRALQCVRVRRSECGDCIAVRFRMRCRQRYLLDSDDQSRPRSWHFDATRPRCLRRRCARLLPRDMSRHALPVS